MNLKFYDQWQLPIFREIAEMEMDHSHQVLVLLAKFEIVDQTGTSKMGEFSWAATKIQFDSLVMEANSVENALMVTSEVQEIALQALNHQLKNIVNHDEIRTTYERLVVDTKIHLENLRYTMQKYNLDKDSNILVEPIAL